MNEFNYEGWIGKIFGVYASEDDFPDVGSNQSLYIVIEDGKAKIFVWDEEAQDYINAGGSVEGAFIYKGVAAAATDLPSDAEPGWLYIAIAEFTIGTEEVEAGDMIIWDGTSWDVIQGNITINDLQSDWNENNASSAAYVKNRPFYDESNDITLTLKPISQTLAINVSDYVTSGEFIEFVEGDSYNVEYDGTLYENLVVGESSYQYQSTVINNVYLGNFDAVLIRSEMGAIVPQEDRHNLVDSDFPFVILAYSQSLSTPVFAFFGTPVQHTLTVTSTSDSSKTYTVVIPSNIVQSTVEGYVIRDTNDNVINQLGVEDGKRQDITINGAIYHGTWGYSDLGEGQYQYSLHLDGYSDEQSQPLMFNILDSQGLATSMISTPDVDTNVYDVRISGTGEIHQLDEKFIPNTIARTSDIPDVPDVWEIRKVFFNSANNYISFSLYKNGVEYTENISVKSESNTGAHIIGTNKSYSINGYLFSDSNISTYSLFNTPLSFIIYQGNGFDDSNYLCTITGITPIKLSQSITESDNGLTRGSTIYGYSEAKSNKVTSITDQSTDTQYPSAKATYDYVASAGFNPSNMTSVDLSNDFGTWDFRASYMPSSSKVEFRKVNKNSLPFNGSIDAYAMILKNGQHYNLTSLGTYTCVDGSFDATLAAGHISLISNGDTLVLKLGSTDGTKLYDGSFTVPLRASSIADGVNGFATGDQVYDYVASQVGNIETLLAQI